MPKIDPRKDLREYHENLRNLILGLGIKLRILEFLDNVGADDQDLKVKNEFGVFFDHIEETLRTDIIVKLCSLFDDKKRSRNLIDYLDKTREYLPGIIGQSVNGNQLESLRDEINSQIKAARGLKPTVDSIKFSRDKYYAHFERRYFDQPEALVADKPLPFRDVITLVDFCKVILNGHEAKVFDCRTSDWAELWKRGFAACFRLCPWLPQAVQRSTKTTWTY